jgi:glycosyltransferase involved in cell wall biosynthesis
MRLTVCVCTHNRPGYVRDCLAGLAAQDVDRSMFEIVLVDSASEPKTSETLRGLAVEHAARFVRLDETGVSLARNVGAREARTPLIAYIDDDAIPAPDWVRAILTVVEQEVPPPDMIGGRILPRWEAPLPRWWPASLRGVLSIIEHEGCGAFRSAALPPGLEPYAANMIVRVEAMRAVGGFDAALGRYGSALLSDEDVRLAWALSDAGYRVVYDSRIVVRHQIQVGRLNPGWLLRRLYWQGASTVSTRRMTRDGPTVWRELPRRLAVIALFAPAALIPTRSTSLIAVRWRLAYALGFARAALGWSAWRAARSSRS